MGALGSGVLSPGSASAERSFSGSRERLGEREAGFFFDSLDHFRNPFFDRRVGEAHPRLFIISRILSM